MLLYQLLWTSLAWLPRIWLLFLCLNSPERHGSGVISWVARCYNPGCIFYLKSKLGKLQFYTIRFRWSPLLVTNECARGEGSGVGSIYSYSIHCWMRQIEREIEHFPVRFASFSTVTLWKATILKRQDNLQMWFPNSKTTICLYSGPKGLEKSRWPKWMQLSSPNRLLPILLFP